MAGAVNAAGDNALVLFDGTGGTINTANAVNVRDGQTLIGGGGSIALTGVTSGRTATATMPGARPTVNGTNNGLDVFILDDDDNVTLKHLNITNGQDGVQIGGGTSSDNIVFDGINIDSPNNAGFDFNFANDVTMSNLNITNTGTHGIAFNADVVDIAFSNVTMNNINFRAFANDGTVTNPSGTITATNVGNLLCSGGTFIFGSTLLINGASCP